VSLHEPHEYLTFPRCRNSLEIEELVAHLVNSIPLRCHADAHMPFSRLLEKTHRRVVSAIENQDFPFALLVELLQKYRDTSRSPIFQVMFSLETTANPPTTIAPRNRSRTSLKMDEMSVIQRVALFDLVLLAHEGPKDIEMVLQYNTKLFDRTTVVRMASHLTNVAKCVTADVAVRLDQVALLSEEERSLVEAAFNDTALPSASTKLVHQLFEQNAFANPTATAVVDSSRHLTYRQLNRSSNAVATMLVERGLAKGQSVAVLVERSAQMVVAMMAILKAKGVYIPIDPKV
jgi:non-ribosomal peptide synthetase component F